jgi:hypothetical protein
MCELSNMIDRNHKPPCAVMKLACRNELVSPAGSRPSSAACGGAIVAVALSGMLTGHPFDMTGLVAH